MRALTVRQPWAWAIVHGGKDVENRTRNVAGGYRGPVAIHAGLAEHDPGFQDATFGAAFLAATKAAAATADLEDICRGPLTRGAFVGIADLVDVHPCWAAELDQVTVQCCGSPWAEFEFVEEGALFEAKPRRLGTIVHLVLANPRPLEVPIPARGMLGLWTPAADVLEQLQAVTA